MFEENIPLSVTVRGWFLLKFVALPRTRSLPPTDPRSKSRGVGRSPSPARWVALFLARPARPALAHSIAPTLGSVAPLAARPRSLARALAPSHSFPRLLAPLPRRSRSFFLDACLAAFIAHSVAPSLASSLPRSLARSLPRSLARSLPRSLVARAFARSRPASRTRSFPGSLAPSRSRCRSLSNAPWLAAFLAHSLSPSLARRSPRQRRHSP